MSPSSKFEPDLIIEATNACNKACRGCYAPNVIVSEDSQSNGVSNLTVTTLEHLWPSSVGVVAIRGGEPTLNPRISELIASASQRCERVYLETGGDWIKPGHGLLKVLSATGCIVKLSVDSMHESRKEALLKNLETLRLAGVPSAVAITERSNESFDTSIGLLPSDFNGEIFVQQKATKVSDLIRPRLGVISAKGEFRETVTNRFQNSSQQTVIAMLSLVFMGISLISGVAQAQIRKVEIGIAANFSAMSDSTSNPYANYFRNAIEMAFSENQERLKSKGIKVQIKEFDYSDDKLKVIETANNVVRSDVLAVIGYIYSSDVLLAGPILNKNKLLMLTPTGTADRIEEIGPFVRRTCFNDGYQGRILGDYAWKNKEVKNVAIVSVADCAYCQSLRTAFKERFEALGGKITFDQTILSRDTSFENIINPLKQKEIDAIFVPNYERISATLIASLLDAGIKPAFWFGGDGWGNSGDLFFRIVGRRRFTAYTISHWHRDLNTPKSKAFFNEFTKRYGKAPVDTAVLAYDSAQLLIQALMNAKRLTGEGVLEAVEKIRTFDGVTGKISYPVSGRTPDKPAVLLKLENGQLVVERVIGG